MRLPNNNNNIIDIRIYIRRFSERDDETKNQFGILGGVLSYINLKMHKLMVFEATFCLRSTANRIFPPYRLIFCNHNNRFGCWFEFVNFGCELKNKTTLRLCFLLCIVVVVGGGGERTGIGENYDGPKCPMFSFICMSNLTFE